jgi:glycosyltransferase involved in cell wall biosynthesis
VTVEWSISTAIFIATILADYRARLSGVTKRLPTANRAVKVARPRRFERYAEISLVESRESDPLKKRMLVICPYPEGTAAGQRLKYEQYFDDWRSVGWEVVPDPFMDLKLWARIYQRGHLAAKLLGVLRGYARRLRTLVRIPRYDLVYCFMYVSPVGPSLFERVARFLARRLVFDVEDNVILKPGNEAEGHPNPFLRFIQGTGRTRFLVQTADHVITSSPSLNQLCLDMNRYRACTYVSSSLDADRFVPASPSSNDRLVTIGWTGTFSTRPYFDLLRSVFQQLAMERNFRLRVIGDFDYELPGVDLEVLRWSAEQEVQQLQGIDIGVYPLPFDDWVGGKSGLKAIQYMMLGLPCVATDVGTTPLIIRHGENGLLVKSEAEWLDALRRLLDDPGLRRRLGERARGDAVSNYSVKAVAADYRRVLRSVMGT